MSNKIKFNEDDLEDDFGAGSSDDEYTEREKYLVKKYKDGKKKKPQNATEEVLGFGSSSEEEEEDDDEKERFEADSDLGSDRDDGIPDAKAWGKTKSSFYNTNYVDQDYGSLSVREEENALHEEQEARAIQIQLAKHLKETDFSLDVFTDGKAAASDEFKPVSAKSVVSKVKADLSSLTTKQKQNLLKKDAPEFRGLVDELNLKVEESYNELEPIIDELKTKNVPESHPICNFIRLKNQLHLTYATNITFYLLLKASQKPIKNHPILKRLVQLKELLNKLDEKYEEHIRPEVERLLDDLQSGKEITFKQEASLRAKPQKKKLNIVKKIEEDADLFGGFGHNDDDGDMDINDDDEEGREIERKMEALLQKVKSQEADDMEDEEGGEEEEEGEDGEPGDQEDVDEKRKITYQMAKNKGLTPHRKKEQRNPRVKHRQKFRKALIRRKGAIRTVRTETSRYSGEHSGIKATVRKGIKIK